jgi:alpha-L-fucosidase
MRLLLSSLVILASALVALAAESPSLDQRAQWFRHDRFGLFIHWGVYSIVGKGEWIRDTGKIPLADYDKLPPQFNPEKFDAAQWVATARRAGQKYLVVTTKHHDGFCMFHTRCTDFNILNTPFKRDVIKELADACHRQGVHLGFYYSIMDWHHPDWLPRRQWEKDRSTEGADPRRYIEFMRNQIRELLTNYGTVNVLWFDGGWETKNTEDLARFKSIIDMARQLQPQILVNNRANIGGDFDTPEQFVPATGIVDRQGRPALWEACITMTTGHGSFAPTAWWGYDRYEKVFKPTDELVQKLIDIASKGGNLLLNIGPQPDGLIRPEENERLEGIGRWMARYGDSIYSTTASPFRLLPFFGRVTQKGNKLFVHVFDWPHDHRLVLPGLRTEVVRAYPFGEPSSVLAVSRLAGTSDVAIALPSQPLDSTASVIVVELAGKVQVEPIKIVPDASGVVRLGANYAEIHAQHGQRARPMSKEGRAYIGNWSNPNDTVVWHFDLPGAGTYRIQFDANTASQEAIGQKVRIRAGKQTLISKITDAGVEAAQPLKLDAGQVTLSVQLVDAKRTGPAIVDLYQVELVPVK